MPLVIYNVFMMRVKILFFCLFGFAMLSVAQDDVKYSAMMLSFEGEGFFVRNDKKVKLNLSQRFLSSDELIIEKGNAVIMLFSGKEIVLQAVSNYTIPAEDGIANAQIARMVSDKHTGRSLLSQSGAAYQLRGQSKVFPISSKILSVSNAILKLDFENIADLKLSLKVFDSQSQKVVYRQNAIADTFVSLAEVPFELGKSYYWVLSNTPGKPEMGTVVMPAETDFKDIQPIDTLQSHYDYIRAISFYYNEKYYFEALQVINMAMSKYPDLEIYPLMRDNLLCQ